MSNTPRDPLRRKGRRCMSITRRKVLGGIAAAGATFVASAPFIAKARAATPDLRLLMWQPYAIKETIQGFEQKFKSRFSPTFFDDTPTCCPPTLRITSRVARPIAGAGPA